MIARATGERDGGEQEEQRDIFHTYERSTRGISSFPTVGERENSRRSAHCG